MTEELDTLEEALDVVKKEIEKHEKNIDDLEAKVSEYMDNIGKERHALRELAKLTAGIMLAIKLNQ